MNVKVPTLAFPTMLAPRLFQITMFSYTARSLSPPLPCYPLLLFSLLVSPLLRASLDNCQSAVTTAALDSSRYLWLFSLCLISTKKKNISPKMEWSFWCFFTSPSLTHTSHVSYLSEGLVGVCFVAFTQHL